MTSNTKEIVGTLKVKVVNGSDIKTKSLVTKSRTFVVLSVGTKKYRTNEKSGKNPKWDEDFEFEISENCVLRADVYNGKTKERIGGLEYNLNETIYIENQNVDMKIYNERKQDKGELHLSLYFQKKTAPLKFISTNQTDITYAATEEEEEFMNKINEIAVKHASNASMKRPSSASLKRESMANMKRPSSASLKRASMASLKHESVSSLNQVPSGAALTRNTSGKIKIHGGRAVKVSAKRRSRSLSPMIPYKPSRPNRSPVSESVYPVRSEDESLGIKSGAFSSPDMERLHALPQYLNSEEELEAAPIAVPINKSPYLTTISTGPNNVGVNGNPNLSKYSKQYAAKRASLKSDNASVYSTRSNRSPLLNIKTSVSSMKKGISGSNSPHSPHSPQSHTGVSPSIHPPKYASNRHSVIKPFTPLEPEYTESPGGYRNNKKELFYEPISTVNDIPLVNDEVRGSTISSENRIKQSSSNVSLNTMSVENKSSTMSYVYSPHHSTSKPTSVYEPLEELSPLAQKYQYKSRNISSDSRTNPGLYSVNNPVVPTDDSLIQVSDINFNEYPPNDNNKNDENLDPRGLYTTYNSGRNSENLDPRTAYRNSYVLGAIKSVNKQMENSTSFDSLENKESENDEDEERGRKITRSDEKEVLCRPAKSKERLRKKEMEKEMKMNNDSKVSNEFANRNSDPKVNKEYIDRNSNPKLKREYKNNGYISDSSDDEIKDHSIVIGVINKNFKISKNFLDINDDVVDDLDININEIMDNGFGDDEDENPPRVVSLYDTTGKGLRNPIEGIENLETNDLEEDNPPRVISLYGTTSKGLNNFMGETKNIETKELEDSTDPTSKSLVDESLDDYSNSMSHSRRKSSDSSKRIRNIFKHKSKSSQVKAKGNDKKGLKSSSKQKESTQLGELSKDQSKEIEEEKSNIQKKVERSNEDVKNISVNPSQTQDGPLKQIKTDEPEMKQSLSPVKTETLAVPVETTLYSTQESSNTSDFVLEKEDTPKRIAIIQKKLGKISTSLKKKKEKSMSESGSIKPDSGYSSPKVNTSRAYIKSKINSESASTYSKENSSSTYANSNSKVNSTSTFASSKVNSSGTYVNSKVNSSSTLASSILTNSKAYSSRIQSSPLNASSSNSNTGKDEFNTYEEPKSMESTKDSISMDKKDKAAWKDKYNKYIKKNSTPEKSKLDQCISENTSEVDDDEESNSIKNNYITYEPSMEEEEVMVIEESASYTENESSIKEKVTPNNKSEESLPNILNLSLSSLDFGDLKEGYNMNKINGKDKSFNSKDKSFNSKDKSFNSKDKSFGLSSLDFGDLKEGYNMNKVNSKDKSYAIVDKTNHNDISNLSAQDRQDLLYKNISLFSNDSDNNIQENNHSFSEQIQNIGNEVVIGENSFSNSGTQQASFDNVNISLFENGNISVINPPRFDSNVNVEETIYQSTLKRTVSPPVPPPRISSNNPFSSIFSSSRTFTSSVLSPTLKVSTTSILSPSSKASSASVLSPTLRDSSLSMFASSKVNTSSVLSPSTKVSSPLVVSTSTMVNTTVTTPSSRATSPTVISPSSRATSPSALTPSSRVNSSTVLSSKVNTSSVISPSTKVNNTSSVVSPPSKVNATSIFTSPAVTQSPRVKSLIASKAMVNSPSSSPVNALTAISPLSSRTNSNSSITQNPKLETEVVPMKTLKGKPSKQNVVKPILKNSNVVNGKKEPKRLDSSANGKKDLKRLDSASASLKDIIAAKRKSTAESLANHSSDSVSNTDSSEEYSDDNLSNSGSVLMMKESKQEMKKSKSMDMLLEKPVFKDDEISDEEEEEDLIIPAQNPRQSKYQNPKSPYIQTPKSPYIQTPKSPYIQTPKSPYIQNPKSPYIQTPKSPYIQNPKSPYIQAPKSPYIQNPKSPYIQNPKSPYIQNPKSPYIQNPKSPYISTKDFNVPVAPMAPMAPMAPVPPVVPVDPVEEDSSEDADDEIEQPITPRTPRTPRTSSRDYNLEEMSTRGSMFINMEERSMRNSQYMNPEERSMRSSMYMNPEERSMRNSMYMNPEERSMRNSMYMNPEERPMRNSMYMNPEERSMRNSMYMNPEERPMRNSMYMNPEERSMRNSMYMNPEERSMRNSQYMNPEERSMRSSMYMNPEERSMRNSMYMNPEERSMRNSMHMNPEKMAMRNSMHMNSEERSMRNSLYYLQDEVTRNSRHYLPEEVSRNSLYYLPEDSVRRNKVKNSSFSSNHPNNRSVHNLYMDMEDDSEMSNRLGYGMDTTASGMDTNDEFPYRHQRKTSISSQSSSSSFQLKENNRSSYMRGRSSKAMSTSYSTQRITGIHPLFSNKNVSSPNLSRMNGGMNIGEGFNHSSGVPMFNNNKLMYESNAGVKIPKKTSGDYPYGYDQNVDMPSHYSTSLPSRDMMNPNKYMGTSPSVAPGSLSNDYFMYNKKLDKRMSSFGKAQKSQSKFGQAKSGYVSDLPSNNYHHGIQSGYKSDGGFVSDQNFFSKNYDFMSNSKKGSKSALSNGMPYLNQKHSNPSIHPVNNQF